MSADRGRYTFAREASSMGADRARSAFDKETGP